jgi:hypothetical protein
MSVEMRYRPLRVLLDAHRLTHRDVVSPGTRRPAWPSVGRSGQWNPAVFGR